MEISGGTIAVSSSTEDNGALDYDGACTLTGGTLFAESRGGVMSQIPSDCEQMTMFVSLGSNAKKGSTVTISEIMFYKYVVRTCNFRCNGTLIFPI